MKINGSIEVPDQAIEDFCKKWKITEFALFGSVLRDDFRPDSDIDVLVRFEEPVPWTLFDIGHMEKELGEILGRRVDLVDWRPIEQSKNYLRRRAILGSAKTVYAAR
jgi:predicted nucleotidyltransferase